ncbi:MAG TPA: tyrosine-type recombinase/integrase [Gemmatimonadaceae bacterium]
MTKRRAPWSKTVEAAGVRVRVYERVSGGPLYREVRLGDGAKDRKSLEHRDRALAQQQAKELARRISELRYAGTTSALTLGQLDSLYFQHRGPLLSRNRKKASQAMVRLLVEHFGRDFAVDDLSQHHIDAYVAARHAGKVRSPRHRGDAVGVRAGTIRNELHLFRAMMVWAQGFRASGHRLLATNPFAGLRLPAERNMKRPIATQARYEALLEVADQVDRRGRFRAVLVLARHTGRRINAICHLRASDILRTGDQVLAALAEAGRDLADADHFPNGGIRWPSNTDKRGYHAVVALSTDARAALDVYLRQNPRVGDAPLFSATQDPSRPVHKETAGHWLRRAETLAKLPKMERGSWHTFRRLWSSERRHLPAQDVAAAGGWRSLSTMRSAYQQADAKTVYEVIENAPAGHTEDTPPSQTAKAQ